jgi:hypothetical protein
LDGAATAGDVAFGSNERSVAETSLGWSYALSERLSVEVDARHEDTRPGAGTGATRYTVSAGSAGIQYAWHEAATVSLSLGRTQQRLKQVGTQVALDSLRLSWAQAISERVSLKLSVAQSRTRQEFVLQGLACPLPLQYCSAGLVSFVPVEQRLRLLTKELQYSASGSLRLSERGSLAGKASRALTPGPLGVSRDDQLSLSLDNAWSERLRGSLGVDESRSSPPGGTNPASRLRTWSLGGSYQWQEGLGLALQLQSRHFRTDTFGSGASSLLFSISLQYSGATLGNWH